MTDDTGTMTSETRYTPFGEVRTDVGTIAETNYGYTNQEIVTDLGLMDYNARMYDPYLNRWTQPDTIVSEPGSTQGLNRYSYSNNNPVNYTDPTGHIATDDECGYQGQDCKGQSQPNGTEEKNGGKKESGNRGLNKEVIPNTKKSNSNSYIDWLNWLEENVHWMASSYSSFWFDNGTRIIVVDHPHQGAYYWHINTDLKILKYSSLDHLNIGPYVSRANQVFENVKKTALQTLTTVGGALKATAQALAQVALSEVFFGIIIVTPDMLELPNQQEYRNE